MKDDRSGDRSVHEPRYPYIEADVAEHEAEEAGALFFELGALGVEQRDETTLLRGAQGKVTLIASFERFDDARTVIAALPPGWSPRLGEVVGDRWRDEWKKHFEPFRLCQGRAGAIVVRPPWRPYERRPDERVIVLEPGRAFGTGLHETTSLVAEVLVSAVSLVDSRVLDVGCGSGILALVALTLGAEFVRAVDVDPDAVAMTRENAMRNGFASRVYADDTPVGALAEQYGLVVANIEAKTLIDLAPALSRRLARGGRLVLSGILAPEVDPMQCRSVCQAYATFRVEEVKRKGDWVAAVLQA
ncbi:MAG TPA: 50S ribosomal protein L11 methyltransferase [Polyangiaceae bacterium]|jgi:ribosomal protein L11 methyltransferase|nr:50S ribosomal protein L11 methyltransferase [Polyangiaceae bacterium]